ncbi:MAG: tetratricopeptide repeat protein [Alphaproteobacteria bacterium]|nr:MAG: tetratricopeptide repeat protein [Alphaproteobacteria bacterium]
MISPAVRIAAILLAAAAPAALPAAAPAAQPAAPPPAGEGPVYTLSAQQWREDLRFMADEMRRRHKNLYHAVSKEAFDAAVADLDARIPSLQRNEIVVGMMRIAAMVGDGHTRVDPRKDTRFGFRSLPLRLYLFEDGLYVRAAAPAQAALVGAKVLAIGGVPTEEAIGRADTLISRDNAMATKLVAPVYLDMPDILHALKLSDRRDSAALKLQKGKRTWTVVVPAGEIAAPWPDDTDGSFITPEGWVDARTTPKPPLWLEAPLDFHRMVPLPERRTLYTQLNEVTGVKDESLADFGRKIRKEAERTNPEKIVVDLRLNFGGNWDLRSGYISELIKAEDDDTHLFVLSARGSFSATEAILVDLRRLSKAVFLGEPASSKPNHYGDGYRSRLPNSQIAIQTSIYWNQLSGQSTLPWTGVHVAVPYSFADYAAGRDPVLEAVFNYAPAPLLFPTLLDAAKAGGAPAALRALADYRSVTAYRYLNFAQIVPGAAEGLYGAGQPEAALAVAEEAARAYPDSVDAWVVLAYVARRTGHPDGALAAARRTIQLDPNNRSVKDIIAAAGG